MVVEWRCSLMSSGGANPMWWNLISSIRAAWISIGDGKDVSPCFNLD